MRSTISDFGLARPVPAALGLDLILDVHGAGAGGDQRSDRPCDAEGAPEPGVGVDQERQPGHAADAAHIGEHVVERGDAEIGQPERPRRDAASGEIDGLEPNALRHPRRVRVDAPDHLQGPLMLHRSPKPRPRRSRTHAQTIQQPPRLRRPPAPAATRTAHESSLQP